MMQFVNDIMINFTVTDFIYAIAYVIENYLFWFYNKCWGGIKNYFNIFYYFLIK